MFHCNKRNVIGVDAANIRAGGGRTHLIELLSAADPVRDGFDEVIVWGAQDTLDKLPKTKWLKKIWVPSLEFGLLRRALWQKYSLGVEAQQKGCSVLFVPGGSFSTNFRPIVTMNQNLLPFETRELWRYKYTYMIFKLFVLRIVQARSLSQADGIIFLTEYAKRIVLRVTGQNRGLTRVIPHGLNSRFFLPYKKFDEQSRPKLRKTIRLIYVSMISPYKHQWNVVEAVAKARSESGIDLQLDLVGPFYAPSYKRLNKSIEQYDPLKKWVNYRGAIKHEELHSLYFDAQVGIWASSCETFGMILLEMMAAGLPILSSNRGPMPEILSDAGLYFDPEKPDTLSDSLLQLLSSENRMQEFSHVAREKACAYSWEKCAKETFRLLQDVQFRVPDRGSVKPSPLGDGSVS